MNDIMKMIAEHLGLVPLYAIIIAYLGFSASNYRHLIMILGILSGVYVTMFKTFNLKMQFGAFDVTQYAPVSNEVGNWIIATAFVYGLGFAAYSVKLMLRAPASAE